MSLDRILTHLDVLVACDTCNPPRAITPGAPVFDYLRSVLPADFDITVSDHGDGRVSLFAVRGKPDVIVNCHLDTVPVGGGWSLPALAMTVKGGRAYGRGACDIKGAAAVLLTLAEITDRPMALLFTTDEEGAHGCCVREFLAAGGGDGFRQAVVCEPTGGRAVFEHRGYLSVHGRFEGVAGHSSLPRALADNANHRLAGWMQQALDYCRTAAKAGRDPCFNVGRIEGGVKNNVIAAEALVQYSARLAPGGDNDALYDTLAEYAATPAEWRVAFSGPPLPAAGRTSDAARAFAAERDLPAGGPVDFWTETSLFSRAGLPALVLGPGDIAQAHAPDEWVTLEELERALGYYRRVFE